MAPFDNDMAQILHKEIYDKGVNLILNDAVVKIDSDHWSWNPEERSTLRP